MSESDSEDWGWKRNWLSYSNVQLSGQQWGEENDGELPGYPLSRRSQGRNSKLLPLAFVCVCVCGATTKLGPSPPDC